jgi:hypothetical protein
MFGDNKRSDRQPVQELLLEVPPATDVPAKERAQIAQLIANGKLGFALDIAKQVHKRCNNAASEALLVDAYVARISSLAERNLEREAMALIDLIRQRYPKAADRLREANRPRCSNCWRIRPVRRKSAPQSRSPSAAT